MKKFYMLLLCFTFFYNVNAQSTTDNNIGLAGKYLGYSTNNTLLFKTNALNRMKLNRGLNYSINGYNGPRSGNLLIARFNSGLYNNNNGAYSLPVKLDLRSNTESG